MSASLGAAPILDMTVPLLAASEPHATALLLAVLGALIAFSVLFSRPADRLGVPVVLLFLVIGMIGGSEGIGGVAFDDYNVAVRLGTLALVLILFDGGLNTSIASIRKVIWPASVLATFGVAATAGLVACSARLFGLGWREAMLLGAVVSSTDAAATFAVLRGGKLHLKPRVGRTLEVESCINDPMAVILTLAMIQVFSAGERLSLWKVLLEVPMQLAIGAGAGLIAGYLGKLLLQHSRLRTVGLYPALTLAIAMISFGGATLIQGSGFLSVYLTALVLGNARRLPHQSGMARVHDALAWLSQISMFLMLGLLVFPSKLLAVAWSGLGVALLLALVARPLAVWLCLLPFSYPPKEIGYIGWAGLRGAVPIILATFPVLAKLPGAEQVFNLVFFIVVVSSIIPGTTIRWVSRKLNLSEPEAPAPAAVLEINSAAPLDGEIASFFVAPNLVVCGATLAELDFPPGTAVVLIVRGQQLMAARGNTRLEAGDHAYVFLKPEDRALIELLFGGAEQA